MIDHIGIAVSDIEKSKNFYSKALAPIGYTLIMAAMPRRVDNGGVAPSDV